jgi:hypothetical protein
MMKKTNEVVRILAALVAGFVGAQIHNKSVTVAAASDDVQNASNSPIGPEGNSPFWDRKMDKERLYTFLIQRGAEIAVIGLQGHSNFPFLNMMGPNSKIRLTLRLDGDDGKPVLGMSDEKWEGQLILGFIQPDAPSSSWDDWGLLLRGAQRESPIASLRITRDPVSGQTSGKAVILGENGKLWVAPNDAKTTQRR